MFYFLNFINYTQIKIAYFFLVCIFATYDSNYFMIDKSLQLSLKALIKSDFSISDKITI